MDSRRKHWEENMFTPFFNAQDVLGETSQLQSSSKPIAIEKIKRTEIICDLSSRKFQDGSDFKRKEYTSQVEKREHGQNSRERRINMTKNVADTNSSPCEASNLDVAAKTDFPRTEGPSIWSKKKFPTVLQQDTRKTWTSGMPPKLRLILLHEEMKELTMTCRKLEEEFETAEKELLNSRRVVPRKSVNFQEAGSDTPKKDWELQALKNDLSVKTTNVKNLTEELQRAKEIIHKLHLENRSLKEAMRKLKHHTQVGNTLLKEEMKLYYELDMEKIRAEIDAIKNELRAEKTLQARNNRALEVFRKHFASKIRTSSPFHDFIGDVL